MNQVVLLDYQQEFNNWRQASPVTSRIKASWQDSDLAFAWQLTVQTDEVPADDAYDSWTTQQKHFLRDLHLGWGFPHSSTEHYMAFDPPLTGPLSHVLDHFPSQCMTYTGLKLTPGHMLAWHFDTFAHFVHSSVIQESNMHRVWRSAMMLTDWNFGHVIQIGNQVISHWQRGDVFSWPCYTWHGTANFGATDMIVLQVSYVHQ